MVGVMAFSFSLWALRAVLAGAPVGELAGVMGGGLGQGDGAAVLLRDGLLQRGQWQLSSSASASRATWRVSPGYLPASTRLRVVRL
jgi:hypothetical protein